MYHLIGAVLALCRIVNQQYLDIVANSQLGDGIATCTVRIVNRLLPWLVGGCPVTVSVGQISMVCFRLVQDNHPCTKKLVGRCDTQHASDVAQRWQTEIMRIGRC